jgi:hypothetical protein
MEFGIFVSKGLKEMSAAIEKRGAIFLLHQFRIRDRDNADIMHIGIEL